MAQTIRATFDGEVLRPEGPVDLEPNTTYRVTIEREAPVAAESADVVVDEECALTIIGRLATDMGITDFAARHDFYAHGRIETDA